MKRLLFMMIALASAWPLLAVAQQRRAESVAQQGFMSKLVAAAIERTHH